MVRAPRKNTRAEPTAGSSGLNKLMGRPRTRTVYKQPVQMVLAPGGKRVIAEGVVDVQDDEDARR